MTSPHALRLTTATKRLAHPDRGFVGREQIRHNWEQLFRGINDISSRVTARTGTDSSVWTEWEMRGTRGDGQLHLMRGVIIFGVTAPVITDARFYSNPWTLVRVE